VLISVSGALVTFAQPPNVSAVPPVAGIPMAEPTASQAAGIAGAVAPQSPPTHVLENAQILARIGTETILASDILPLAEQALDEKLSQVPKEQRDLVTTEQYDKLKWQFARSLLEQLVDVKIRYADAIANIPKENLPHIKSSINDSFEKTALKKLMEKYQAATRAELEEKMAGHGQSLDRQRQMYLERSLAAGWESQHVKENREVALSEILGYYQQHIADFQFPAKARWEELMVDINRFNNEKEAAAALCEMGNEVLRGAQFGEVAKARSHGPTRFDGGVYDWTTKGSLLSKVLDEAIFGLPVGSMSQILKDEQGLHIVRVIERVDAGQQSFLEAQTTIRKKLHDEDIERQRKDFVAKMKQRTVVWTVFDDAAKAESDAAAVSAKGAEPQRR
jgi:parvulin-like peptidyl-prolyl isomerase